MASSLKSLILEQRSQSVVLLNQVPASQRGIYTSKKFYLSKPDAQGFCKITPPISAFEVFIDAFYVYSKVMNKDWPHLGSLAHKIKTLLENVDSGHELEGKGFSGTSMKRTAVLEKHNRTKSFKELP